MKNTNLRKKVVNGVFTGGLVLSTVFGVGYLGKRYIDNMNELNKTNTELISALETLESSTSELRDRSSHVYRALLLNSIVMKTEPQVVLSNPSEGLFELIYFIEEDGKYLSLTHQIYYNSTGELERSVCTLRTDGHDYSSGHAYIDDSCDAILDYPYGDNLEESLKQYEIGLEHLHEELNKGE